MSKFWGLSINAGKKFKQQVEEAFCLSGAALEPSENLGAIVQLYLQKDQNDILICSLVPKQGIYQVPLNVRVGRGETVGFHLKGGSLGKTKVHLSGFTLPFDDDGSAIGGVPFQGQSQSILVTDPKSEDKLKKRVSIQDEPYGEMESEESSDDDDVDDDELIALRKKLFNGGDQIQEDSSDDDDEDDDEIELDDDDDDDDDESIGEDDMPDLELQELQQLKLTGKVNPASSKKTVDDSITLDDSDEDDSPKANISKKGAKRALQTSKNQQESPSPTKQKNKLNTPSDQIPKTPENKHIKLKTPSSAGHTPMKTFTKGGVLVNDIKVGNGQVAKPGKMVAVNYVGRLKQNNKQFDANNTAKGFSFRLGKGEVIKGWDLGVDGMKIGGKRRLIIPPQLAYGKRGAAPDIPPNSTLVFEVELKNVS